MGTLPDRRQQTGERFTNYLGGHLPEAEIDQVRRVGIVDRLENEDHIGHPADPRAALAVGPIELIEHLIWRIPERGSHCDGDVVKGDCRHPKFDSDPLAGKGKGVCDSNALKVVDVVELVLNHTVDIRLDITVDVDINVGLDEAGLFLG
jgi:hypothetical protein